MEKLTIVIEAPCRSDCLAVVAGIAEGLDPETMAGLIADEGRVHDVSVGTTWQALDGTWTTLHNDVTWSHRWGDTADRTTI